MKKYILIILFFYLNNLLTVNLFSQDYLFAKKIEVLNNSSKMLQHKGIVSGPIDNISIPNIISLGDVIKNNKVSLEVKLIEVTKIEKDMIWRGNVIAKAGATHCVLVEEKKYFPHLENNIDKIWIFVSDCKVLE